MQPSVQLRPTTEADLPVLARFQSEADISGQFNWFGFYQFGGPAALRRRWMENGLIDSERGLLIVTHADDPALVAGEVTWRSHSMHGSCWAIGCVILPQWRGRGCGTAAQRCLAHYLFANTQARRIEAYTDSENLAEQRALTKAGFHQEGTIRGSQFRTGAWHDMILYGRVRNDDSQRTS